MGKYCEIISQSDVAVQCAILVANGNQYWKQQAGWSDCIVSGCLSSSGTKRQRFLKPFVSSPSMYSGKNNCYHCNLPDVIRVKPDDDALTDAYHRRGYYTNYPVVSEYMTDLLPSESGSYQKHMEGAFSSGGGDSVTIVIYNATSSWLLKDQGLATTATFHKWKKNDLGSYDYYSYVTTDSNVDRVYGFSSDGVRNWVMTVWKDERFSLRSRGSMTFIPIESDVDPMYYAETLFDEQHNGARRTSKRSFDWAWLEQQAFYDACRGIGKMNDNTIQNLIEFYQGIALTCSTLGLGSVAMAADKTTGLVEASAKKSLLQHELHYLKGQGEVVGDAWLGYRYSYSTTKSDYEQFCRYTYHKYSTYMNFLDNHYYERSYGSAQRVVDGINVKCTCHIGYRPRSTTLMHDMCLAVHNMGLEINPYVLWDMVPLSFVVDWFSPVGDILDVISNRKYYSDQYYDFQYVGFSISYDFGDERGKRYMRYYTPAVDLDASYWFDDGDKPVSTQLKLKRTADAISLII